MENGRQYVHRKWKLLSLVKESVTEKKEGNQTVAEWKSFPAMRCLPVITCVHSTKHNSTRFPPALLVLSASGFGIGTCKNQRVVFKALNIILRICHQNEVLPFLLSQGTKQMEEHKRNINSSLHNQSIQQIYMYVYMYAYIQILMHIKNIGNLTMRVIA